MESDNIQNCPPGPHCVISRPNHVEMWKKFDVGLHEWLVRYIFKPILGAWRGAQGKEIPGEKKKKSFWILMVASICAFGFTCFWHAAHTHICIWAAI